MTLTKASLPRLKWTKCVRPVDRQWAYKGMKVGQEWSLHWSTKTKTDAHTPSTGDLILLRQYGRVTHVVELLNETINQDSNPDYSVAREVRLLWVPINNDLKKAPTQHYCFGNTELKIIRLPQNGRCYLLQDLKAVQTHWNTIEAFQKHVANVLGLP